MDRQLTFEILLYLNIFYTSFFVFIEGLFLVIKFFHVDELRKFPTFRSYKFLESFICLEDRKYCNLGTHTNQDLNLTPLQTCWPW